MKPHNTGKRGPARKVPRATLTLRLEPEDKARLERICEKRRRSYSQQLAEWVRRAKV